MDLGGRGSSGFQSEKQETMKTITSDDLYEAGYDAATVEAMLPKLDELIVRGVTGKKYLLKLLAREFGDPPSEVADAGEAIAFSRGDSPGDEGGKGECRFSEEADGGTHEVSGDH